MRWLTIAEELRAKGMETTFITADHYADELIQAKGFNLYCLETVWNDMESEDEKIIRYLIDNNVSVLLVDSYYVTDNYLEQLLQYVKIIYLDDIGKVNAPVNMIINYNIYAYNMEYSKIKNNGTTRLIFGSQYAPLRSEFQHINSIYHETIKKIMISTGGADQYNIAGKLMEYITKYKLFQDIEFHVIVGSFNKNVKFLLELQERNKQIVLHQNITRMSELMCQCDVAVSACGSTMYELCACGIPILTFSFADNQRPGVEGFEKEKVAINCGDIRDGLSKLILSICEKIEILFNHTDLRYRMYMQEKKVVDGIGVVRLGKLLLDLCK